MIIHYNIFAFPLVLMAWLLEAFLLLATCRLILQFIPSAQMT